MTAIRGRPRGCGLAGWATRAKAPPIANFPGVLMGGPVMIAHGTEEQKERYLEPILSAEEIWCQGFSEPESGEAEFNELFIEDAYVPDENVTWEHDVHFLLKRARVGAQLLGTSRQHRGRVAALSVLGAAAATDIADPSPTAARA